MNIFFNIILIISTILFITLSYAHIQSDIDRIQYCQQEYNLCTKYCKDYKCLNECADRLKLCYGN